MGRGITQSSLGAPPLLSLTFQKGSSLIAGPGLSSLACLQGRFSSLYLLYTEEFVHAQSCPTLCDPMDSPGSSVHGISQAKIVE